MNTPANSDKRPLEVEIVRPLTVGTALGDLFSAIAILALTAWGLDILIAQPVSYTHLTLPTSDLV